MVVILVLTVVIIGVLTFYLINNNRELRAITMELSRINNGNTDSRILLSTSNKIIHRLAYGINTGIELRKTTELKYKNIDRELKQAINNITHDLRTPLTSITGYLQLIEDNSLSESERKKYIEVIRKRAEALQVLTTSFYDLSRLESGEYSFNLTKLNLVPIIQDVLVSFYNNFLDKDIEPIVVMGDSPLYVIGDIDAIGRIITNLIQNILRYGEKNAVISCERVGNKIIMNFTNSAPLLKPSDIPYLFDRFFTGDNARSNSSTGLGLSIVKQLVTQMGHNVFARFNNEELSIIVEWKEL